MQRNENRKRLGPFSFICASQGPIQVSHSNSRYLMITASLAYIGHFDQKLHGHFGQK